MAYFHEYRRPEVTYTGTGLEKRYRDWLVHLSRDYRRKVSTASELHRQHRVPELIHFMEENT